ncbi:MAG: carboxypeptidase-like regulatory domain-containing protein, partial [Prevotella sp.]|nr:carboxypeptidase-like regulatory domain-containing protein [Prevotella sp.]
MNKLKFIKGKALPFAALMSAMLFVPSTGMLSARAAVQNVQQQETIKGLVVDNTGEPVIGASVIVVGAKTTTGTVTDFDGNFTLKVNPGTQLKIT